MGLSATFTVRVNGSPLNYQWEKNGEAIPGATSSSLYTTPAAAFADNGAKFTLTISNSLGSVTSDAATLTVSARSPKPGDLRFQQVDAASTVYGYAGEEGTNLNGWNGFSFNDATGTPLSIGPGCPASGSDQFGCTWFLNASTLPPGQTGLRTYYQGFAFENLASELNTLNTANTVVTGLDLQPLSDTFGASWIQTDGAAGFYVSQHTASAADFQAAAAQDGVSGRVITAVSWQSGEIFYLAYGWQGDSGTTYDVQTVPATIDTVEAVSTQLASQGYIITASGGTLADGILLVGTRVHGDTMPRPIKIIHVPQDGSAEPLAQEGYAVVALIYDIDNRGNLLANYWIGER